MSSYASVGRDGASAPKKHPEILGSDGSEFDRREPHRLSDLAYERAPI